MNLLYANDRRGELPPSWYAATATPLPRQPALKGEVRADVCVIGAGYTGLSAALHLAQRGLDVVVVEAQRAGFGASGRNGGHVGTGFNLEPWTLEKLTSKSDARRLWDLAEEGKALTRALIAAHAPDAQLRDGIAHAQWQASGVTEYHKLVDWLAENYDYTKGEKLDREAMQALVKSPRYQGGIVDWGSGHIHPLNYALGLARACLAAGVRIYEGSLVHHIARGTAPVVQTDQGRVRADHVVLATNGYGGNLVGEVAARSLPINNFMVATAPLGAQAREVLARDIAVDDSKFVVNYFHLSEDHRLIFGGGESYGYRFPADIAAKVRPRLETLFPQLKGVEITHAWGGTLAITMTRMPYLARPDPNLWAASGYSGYGVSLSGFCGKLIAEAIAGETDRFDLMASVPATRFPGGKWTRHGLLTLAMTWYALRDRLGV